MYNFSKLSEMSRTFVSTVRAGQCANIAAAKAVANHLALPSGPVEDSEQHYRDVHYGAARQIVSDLNEVLVINARDVLELVQAFWKARYAVAYPGRTQPLNLPETCYAFFGYGQYIPGNVLCEIDKGGNTIVRYLNGFTAVLLDLTHVPEAQTTSTGEPLGDAFAQESFKPTKRAAKKVPALETKTQEVPVVEAPGELAQEGFVGALKGYLLGGVTLGFANVGMKRKAEELKKQIEHTAGEIEKLRNAEAKAALSAGKMDQAQYDKDTAIGKEKIISYSWTDFLFSGYAGAIYGSRVQNREKELKRLTGELQTLIQAHGGKPEGEMSQEQYYFAVEGFMGGLKGFILGDITWGFSNVKAKNDAEHLRKEIKKISEEIQKLREQGAKAELDKGRISVDEYKAEFKRDENAKGKKLGYEFTDFLSPGFNGAKYGSQVQDLTAELKEKVAEINKLLKHHGTQGKGE